MDIDIDNLPPVNEKDKTCAPNMTFENGSCYALGTLMLIATMYNKNNKNNPNVQIKLDRSYETIHPHKYKRYLVSKLHNRLSDKCTDQKCWLEQDFMQSVAEKNREEIEKLTFRPEGPEGKFEWLSTVNIDEVMEQYHIKYPDFQYLGTVPMDFDDLPVLGIKNLNFDDLYKKGKKRLGIIFNLDEHDKSGSHWVSMFSDLEKGQIYYFDSYGIRPEQRVRRLMKRINDFLIKKGKTPDINYNQIRHQYKNSECGVYSINFIVRCLRGESFKSISESRISDEKINKCRSKYFTKA